MLIDLHTHTYPASTCARGTIEEVINHSIEAGLDGIVLANHYQKSYITDTGITHKEFIDKYINTFLSAEKYGKEHNFKVFFAVELTYEASFYCHLLIYGVPFDFLYENPEIYDMDIKDVYRIVKKYNGALIQAHPYRMDVEILDPSCVDGVEINCHVRFGETHSKKILDFARKNSMHVTCGSDYHATHRRPKCGMVIPDYVNDGIELKDYILSDAKKTLLVDELDGTEPSYITVDR